MNKLKMKAKAGVTLVELLVVILIVTILSVSMLPLLQPFVTEAQYAAEAIPVIGNLRTKIGLYLYDKGVLPYDDTVGNPQNVVQTWKVKEGDTTGDVFEPSYYQFDTGTAEDPTPYVKPDVHVQNLLDIDYQDLKGKRSKPTHYQYLVLSTNASSYVIGCFGDGKGLKAGTGYAVCELNFPKAGRKLVGTWKRYKSFDDAAGKITFSTTRDAYGTKSHPLNCYIPDEAAIAKAMNYVDKAAVKNDKGETTEDAVSASAEVEKDIIIPMRQAGWEF